MRTTILTICTMLASVAAWAQTLTATDVLQSLTCQDAQGETVNLTSALTGLRHGETGVFGETIIGQPTGFAVSCKQGFSATASYENGVLTVVAGKGNAGNYTTLANGDLQHGTSAWDFSATGGAWSDVLESDPKVVEAYAGWSSLDLTDFAMKQSVNLPVGTYKLKAYGFYRHGLTYDVAPTVSGAQLYAGSASMPLATLGSLSLPNYANNTGEASAAFKAGLYLNELQFSVANDGETVELGVKGKHELKQSWCIAGPFALEPVSAGYAVFYVKLNIGRAPKGKPTALKRGLVSINLSSSKSSGNLVSWRYRKTDDAQVKFKLWRGTSAKTQNTKVNGGKFITDRTNFRDTGGNTSHYYRLEVYDLYDNLLESEVSGKTWANQTMQVKTNTPTDTRGLGATYTPNDASFCDMDGDGEYEIILKWDPSNSKDAASDGVTSDTYFDCYKLDGTQLWRINQGPNIRSGAHTTPFVAWDLDGDGYGEFMIKTAPGTVDGEGKYVVMAGDDPLQNCLSGRGKPDKGPEYITVFDGVTGAELSTIKYHTDYAAGSAYWGDSKQNRSERYLACVAYLDGEDKNPSAIFDRGYYAGAFVGAYDFDGVQLKERWVSRNTQSGKGLWGEGAHWMTGADLDGDGKHEILFGSAALDHDGKLLWRTGLGHGDALHVGDFLTDRPGLEVFMAHESKPYGVDLRDAKTGTILLHPTASGDTGRGLAAHFDSTQESAQFMYSASGSIFNCADGSVNGAEWKIGNSGAGINARVYWDGDLYDEFFDKSIIAHWNPTNKWFDRIQVNGGNYTWGTLCNGTKFNPCVLGDLIGDWREEIVTYDNDTHALVINATSYESQFIVPHLMDDVQYRENIISQNCAYNQPPHLSFDPAIVYAGNPIATKTEENMAVATGIGKIGGDAKPMNKAGIYTLQGVRMERIIKPGIYIIDGKKTLVK